MKKHVVGLAVAVFAAAANLAYADTVVLTGDSQTSSASPASTAGAVPSVSVRGPAPKSDVYLGFGLSELPAGSVVGRATLRVWARAVADPGLIDVYAVSGVWDEATLSWAGAPPRGALPLASAAVSSLEVNHYVMVDVTSTVQGWMNNPATNQGFVLASSSVDPVRVDLDSKENQQTSHPAELEVVLAGPAGPAGSTGTTGPAGDPGESVVAMSIDVGNANCPFGGAQFTVNGVSAFACNGAPGQDGASGTPGAQGPAGPSGPVGLQGPVGPSNGSSPGVANVLDFGAIPDDFADDAPAIQAAIDSLEPTLGGRLVLPRGVYRIMSPLVIRADASVGLPPPGAYGRPFMIRFEGAGRDTVLQWHGSDPTVAVLDLQGMRDSAFMDFTIDFQQHGRYGVRSRTLSGYTSTTNTFRNIVIEGNSNLVEKAFAFQPGALPDGSPNDANNDVMRFEDVHAQNFSIAGFSFEHPQSKGHIFYGCTAVGSGCYGVSTALAEYDATLNARGCPEGGHSAPSGGSPGGSFSWHDGGGGGTLDAFFKIGPVNDYLNVTSANIENSYRLLDTWGQLASMPVTIIGTRFDNPDNAAVDGYCVRSVHPGPLVLLGNSFTTSAGSTCQVLAGDANPNDGGAVVALGNRFGATLLPADGSDWLTLQNITDVLATGSFAFADDTLGNTSIYHYPNHAAPLSGLQVGEFTLVDSDSTATVLFTAPEADTEYRLSVTPTEMAGAPDPACRRIASIDKTPQGFTVTFEGAPGTGAAASFDWQMLR